jgi:protein O-mannosyl-transferase
MPRPQSIRPFAIICLVLALGTAALYWPLTRHAFVNYDDNSYIRENPHVTTGLSWANVTWAFTNTESRNWHPLTWLTHQLDVTLFGLNAGRHHLVDLLLHVVNSLLVFVLLRNATGSIWRSAMVAALFAWHPTHVESVAWASERKDVLRGFFWLLCLVAYVRYAATPAGSRRWGAYLLAMFFCACGLLSKAMVVTLPCLLLLLDFWPLNRLQMSEFSFTRFRPLLWEKLPFFVLSMAVGLINTAAQYQVIWNLPFYERMANALASYVSYVAKLFYPTDLTILYLHPVHIPWLAALASLLALGLWTGLCLAAWRKHPYLICGWFWFVVGLLPAIGLVQVGAQAMADRYAYIPSIGFFIAVIWGVASLRLDRMVMAILGTGVLLACLLMTRIQLGYWQDSVSLFQHAVEVEPDNFMARSCLGEAYEAVGDPVRARQELRLAVRLEPRFAQAQFKLAVNDLACGDEAGALEHYSAAVKLEPRDFDFQIHLGALHARRNEWSAAADCFSNGVAIRPGSPVAHRDMAKALGSLGRYQEAALEYQETLRLQPDFTDAQAELNALLAAHPEAR